MRKYIIKSSQNITHIIPDEVALSHEDIIVIIHSCFTDKEIRKMLTDGIKGLFISYKIQNAKAYSCVFMEYVLQHYDMIERIENEEMTISRAERNRANQQSVLGYSASLAGVNSQNRKISSSKNDLTNFQSALHEENGLYRKVKNHNSISLHGYKIIDQKFNHGLSLE